MAILFKKQVPMYQSLTGTGKTNPVEYKQEFFTPILGRAEYETEDQINKWRSDMNSKLADDSQLGEGTLPSYVLKEEEERVADLYNTHANKFITQVQNAYPNVDIQADLINQSNILKNNGLTGQAHLDALANYAINKYKNPANKGGFYIPKDQLFEGMSPEDLAILRESRRRIDAVRKAAKMKQLGNLNKAGEYDVDNSDFGFRNYISPYGFIRNKPQYYNRWNTPAPERGPNLKTK